MLPMTQVTVDPILSSAWTESRREKAKIALFGGKIASAGARFRARISARPKVVLSQGLIVEENVFKVVL